MSTELQTLHATELYSLKAAVRKDRLCLDLVQTQKGFAWKSFSGDFALEDFSASMRQNFTNFENLCSFMSDPSHCKI